MRTRIKSLGTSSRAGIVVHAPSRLTRACNASFALSAAIAFPAWYSSQKPTPAFIKSKARMMPKSSQWWTTADRVAATSIIQGIGPQKYERNLRRGFVLSSGISLQPYLVSRACTSELLRPSAETPKTDSTDCSEDVAKSGEGPGSV